MTSQQFGHAAHAIPSSNVGMPVVQGQQLRYSQPMQQLTARPIQPGHPLSLSQAMSMPYIQTNRPLTSVPPHAQQAVPHISNHMPGLAVSGAIPHSSYTFTPSYGQQQDNANALPQYQHPPHMLAPPAGQPWSSSVSQSAAAVTSVQPAGVQSSGTTYIDRYSMTKTRRPPPTASNRKDRQASRLQAQSAAQQVLQPEEEQPQPQPLEEDIPQHEPQPQPLEADIPQHEPQPQPFEEHIPAADDAEVEGFCYAKSQVYDLVVK